MILTALASLLLFFITYFTGVVAINLLNRFFSFSLATDFFETFLLGLMSSFIYFNLLSFFIAVNYTTLLPLVPLSITGFVMYSRKKNFILQLASTCRQLFSGPFIFFTIPLFLLLFMFWIVPPFNQDSGEYHYLSIRWYEQFKVVPGLANVHGRLAFNPANFIISAAFSFTDVAGQPLYPLNGVLVVLFYTWVLRKIRASQSGMAYSLILITCSIVLFRTTLVNISSPSSDLLSTLLLFYCCFRTYELIKDKKNLFSDYLPVGMFVFFAVTAKLSALPALLILPFIFFLLTEKNQLLIFLLKSSLLAVLLMVPWMARNMILSGYLLYPLPGTDIVHFDWTVPNSVFKLEYIYTKYGARTKDSDYFLLQKMNLYQLDVVWLKSMYAEMKFGLAITLLSLLSVFTWLILLIRKIKISTPVFLLWGIYYCGLWIWFINSPAVRFGLPYIIICTAIPLFELARTLNIKSKFYFPVISLLMFFYLGYYFQYLTRKDYFSQYSIAKNWLKPASDKRYSNKNDLRTFAYTTLTNGLKLYYADSSHECLNADGPCMNWRYGEIEMRGNKIEDGFRNTKDEVKKYYPFVDIKK